MSDAITTAIRELYRKVNKTRTLGGQYVMIDVGYADAILRHIDPASAHAPDKHDATQTALALKSP